MNRIALLCVCLLLPFVSLDAQLRASDPVDVTVTKFHSSAYDEREPRIATDGTSYFSVWSSDSLRVRAAHISRYGDVAAPLTIANGLYPEVMFAAGRYFVTWWAHGIRGAFVDANGVTPVIEIAEAPNGTRPMIAFDGKRFLVMWRVSGGDYDGAFVSTDGVVTSRVHVPLLNVQRNQTILSAGGRFYLTNASGGKLSLVPITDNGAGTPIVLARVTGLTDVRAASANGAAVLAWQRGNRIEWLRFDGAASPVASFAAGLMSLQRVAAAGNDVLLVYGTPGALFARSATPGAEPFALPLPQNAARVGGLASANGELAIAFENDTYQHDSFVVLEGGLRGPQVLDVQQNTQYGGGIAMGSGSLALATWHEWRGEGPAAIVGGRIDASGRSLDVEGIDLLPGGYGVPRVAWSGTQWLVTGMSVQNVLRATRVGIDGKPIDTTPIALVDDIRTDRGNAPVWNGSEWVIAFCSGGDANQPNVPVNVDSIRVSAEGKVFGRMRHATLLRPEQVAIASSDDGQALIVWRSPAGVFATFGTTTLTLYDHGASSVSVAWTGTHFLVAYVANRNFAIEWKLVDPNGNVTTPSTPFIPVVSAVFGISVDVTPFEGDTLLVWNDRTLNAALLRRDGTIAVQPTVLANETGGAPRAVAGSLILQTLGITNDESITRVVTRRITRE